MISIVSERKIGKKKFLSKKNEILSKLVIFNDFEAKFSKNDEKSVETFFWTAAKKFSFGQMTMFKVFKRCLLNSSLRWEKKIMVIGFVDQKIFQKNNPPPKPLFWGGGCSFNAYLTRSGAACCWIFPHWLAKKF